ncbi:type I pantothenate kinase [Tessaracoccus antarcticus]|uniref:Pantothenate kinase n=1 Tax=Tessaracoccus antarcticus TaxID=2479848 RepID=A0A3M0GME2_9ACTN|nr:type I pantothenate kinase [Tessaracoccus antarcticus]RMB58466.1 type I pantothenate kinase [Tessaracoccus antarcticus]
MLGGDANRDETTVARPFVVVRRGAWSSLADATQIDVDEATLARLRGLGDPTSQEDVAEIYRPLTQLLHLYMANACRLRDDSNEFLRLRVRPTPFVIGVAGSVAVGKSTTSRLLQELLRRAPGSPRVDLVTTDGFLYPNAELESRGLLERKGFPESYNRRALLQFVVDVKSGVPHVEVPVYSHLIYDIDPEHSIVVESPDILIIEGLNVLQPARIEPDGTSGPAVSDFFDFSVFVDADEADIKRWFLERFMALRDTAFQDERSYFKQFTTLGDTEAWDFASQVWDDINGPNLRFNIVPTRDRATAILRKGPNHSVQTIAIRKV